MSRSHSLISVPIVERLLTFVNSFSLPFPSFAFTFAAALRLNILDLITMALMGAIGLGVYFADPAPTRNFPIYNNNSEVVYPEFAYPVSSVLSLPFKSNVSFSVCAGRAAEDNNVDSW